MQNWLKPLLAVPIGITIVDVLGYVARVDGESMKPTLNPNLYDSEYVFLNKVRNRKEISCKHGVELHLIKLQYKAKGYSVQRGEIVCLISPKDPQQRLIKRVIGCQGRVLRIEFHLNANELKF